MKIQENFVAIKTTIKMAAAFFKMMLSEQGVDVIEWLFGVINKNDPEMVSHIISLQDTEYLPQEIETGIYIPYCEYAHSSMKIRWIESYDREMKGGQYSLVDDSSYKVMATASDIKRYVSNAEKAWDKAISEENFSKFGEDEQAFMTRWEGLENTRP
jgi:hypothetical protein